MRSTHMKEYNETYRRVIVHEETKFRRWLALKKPKRQTKVVDTEATAQM